nr:bifunctional ornithine acetyltransferase/N-acetylglutamate synthase [uncultured Solibaculum sp.]
MSCAEFVAGGVTCPKGFEATGVSCGIKPQGKDLMLIAAQKPCAVAAVYTKSAVKGAPLTVTAQNILHGRAQAVVCNSGIANCCVEGGVAAAKKMCSLTAKALHIPTEDVIVASTGEMGVPLPMKQIEAGIGEAADTFSKEGGHDAALAILTDDSMPKELAVEFLVGDVPCHIGGVAKGAGMLRPNMATLLCFLTSDVNIHPELLDRALKEAVDQSFHRMALGGFPSPNDMVTILSSGLSGNGKITDLGDGYQAFSQALKMLCLELMKWVAKDSCPGGRLLTCQIHAARTERDALIAAKSVASCSQVRKGLSNGLACWTDIVCAIGGSGANVDGGAMDVSLLSPLSGEMVHLCGSCTALFFDDQKVQNILKEPEVILHIDCNDGFFDSVSYGCLDPIPQY